MTPLWFAQTIVGAAISFAIWSVLAWVWARRKLIPFLRQHGPKLMAMYEDSRTKEEP